MKTRRQGSLRAMLEGWQPQRSPERKHYSLHFRAENTEGQKVANLSKTTPRTPKVG